MMIIVQTNSSAQDTALKERETFFQSPNPANLEKVPYAVVYCADNGSPQPLCARQTNSFRNQTLILVLYKQLIIKI